MRSPEVFQEEYRHMTLQQNPALTFHDVSMVFPDGTRALDHVSLSISPGEFVTVVAVSYTHLTLPTKA